MTLDVSDKPYLQHSKYWSDDKNQLYHPSGELGSERCDLVFTNTDISNRFLPILIKEWFTLLSPHGLLIIQYTSLSKKDSETLEETLWWLWKKKYKIIYHGPTNGESFRKLNEQELIDRFKKFSPVHGMTRSGNKNILVCQKKSTVKLHDDSIEKWTFGIITNGKRDDWVERIIESIRIQKIPKYEIIICGTYFNRKEPDIKYLSFSERDDLGWITKKKNLIVEKSKYQNICIIHDRVTLGKKWYSGMKKWGNTFEHLGCSQKMAGARVADWVIHEQVRGQKFGYATTVDYREWGINIFQSGTLHIIKKTYALDNPWNESFLWANGRAEDLDISNRLTESGKILRLNPFSSIEVLSSRFTNLPTAPYEEKKQSRQRVGNKYIIIGRKIFSLASKISPTLGKKLLTLSTKIKR